MEGGSKKRKMSHSIDDPVPADVDQEDDEKKMEQFFALIRTLKEARARFDDSSAPAELVLLDKQNVNHNLHNGQGKKHMSNHDENGDQNQKEKPVNIWKPSFLIEDFAADDVELILRDRAADPPMTPVLSSNPRSTQAGQKEELNEGLDLKLSLY